MQLVSGLTKHTILIAVEKRERGVPMQTVLSKMGYKPILTVGMADALREAGTNMPHLIIAEALLGDGNAGNFYDRLRQDPVLKNVPMLINVLKKSKEELTPLKGRSFAGIAVGILKPSEFASKVKQALDKYGNASPYMLGITNYNLDVSCSLILKAAVVGNKRGQLVVKSGTEVDASASLIAVPENKKMAPIMLQSGTNLKQGDEIFNLFPLSRIKGKGRKWVTEVPEFGGPAEKTAAAAVKKVLYFDPDPKRYAQMKPIMSGYDIDLIHAPTIQHASMLIKQSTDYGCIFLFELANTGQAVEFKKVYASLDAATKPPLIVATSSQNRRSTAEMRYVKKPFGIGVIVEAFEAACERATGVVEAVEKNPYTMDIQYQAPIKVIGLDETGGVIQIKFPVVIGSEITINHKELNKLWDGDCKVTITEVAVFPDKPDVWQARFDSVPAGTSKAKYMQKVEKFLEPFKKPEDSAKAA